MKICENILQLAIRLQVNLLFILLFGLLCNYLSCWAVVSLGLPDLGRSSTVPVCWNFRQREPIVVTWHCISRATWRLAIPAWSMPIARFRWSMLSFAIPLNGFESDWRTNNYAFLILDPMTIDLSKNHSHYLTLQVTRAPIGELHMCASGEYKHRWRKSFMRVGYSLYVRTKILHHLISVGCIRIKI